MTSGFAPPKNPANRLAWRDFLNGGAEGDRTPDLRIANATLSQLSYGPEDDSPAAAMFSRAARSG